MRERFAVLRNCFIPVSLIAGVLALAFGQSGLKILPFSEQLSQYSGTLMICLSASLFLGNNGKLNVIETVKRVGDSFLINCASEIGQFGVFILLGYAVTMLFQTVSPWIGMLLPAGFVGSHGTAAVMSTALSDAGYAQAFSIGQTFATVGLLFGILSGVAFINLAVRKGYTAVIHSMEQLPEELRRDDIPACRQDSIGNNTVNSIAVDTLTYHIMLIFCAVALANLGSWLLGFVFPEFSVPVYALAFVSGMLVQQIIKKCNLEQSVDRNLIIHISGTLTDYIVAFGIASVDLHTVVQYWPPIVLLSVVGFCYCTFMLFGISRYCFKDHWFERGIFVFGWSSAAMPIAMMLLRIADPDYSSGILEDANMAWIFLNFVDLLLVTFLPVMVINGHGIISGLVLTAIAAMMLLLCRVKYGRKKDS